MDKGYYKDFFILEKTHWLFRVRRKILLYFIKEYTQFGSKIFDFGCGSGHLVGELQKIGYDAWGMDFEKEAVDFGLNSGIKNLNLGSGSKLEYPDSSFDLITAFDVLEHIENEKPVIREFIRILKPGGRIIITVPAYKWLWGVQDEISHHFRRYSLGSLAGVFKNFSELRIIKKTYFNTLLFPPIAFVRLISRWFNIKNRKSDFEIGNPLLDLIFYHIFNLEYYLIKFINFPFGVSVCMVLEKNDSSVQK